MARVDINDIIKQHKQQEQEIIKRYGLQEIYAEHEALYFSNARDDWTEEQYAATWRLCLAVTHCKVIKARAAELGLLADPCMQKIIKDAEQKAKDAELNYNQVMGGQGTQP